MRVIISKDYADLSEWAALYIKARIQKSLEEKGKCVLGLPTGSTPIGVYQKLIDYYEKGELSFKNVYTFNMDEYVGLSASHHQSYHYFMNQHFFDHIDIPKENIHILNGTAYDLQYECEKYEEKIQDLGPIDIFLGGVGADGHIAFNEPGSSLTSKTRIKTLVEDTIQQNARFFDNDPTQVPRSALTVGIRTIMDAKELLLLASGSNKALAVQQIIEGPVSTQWTGSVIQQHPKAIFLCDLPATDELKVKTTNYYLSLQKQITLEGLPADSLSKYISSSDKILVTSPHPDDDVIGMGGILQLFPNKSPDNVKIMYMTSGSGGLSQQPYNPRISEATGALTALGYSKDNILTPKFPFYYTKSRNYGPNDIKLSSDLLEQFQPNHLFICSDLDPHHTHLKCRNILLSSDIPDSVKYIWYYYGAWKPHKYITDPSCPTRFYTALTFPIQTDLFEKKELAIKLHLSQFPAPVPGDDPREFFERAQDLNRSNNFPGHYEETFELFDWQAYLRNERTPKINKGTSIALTPPDSDNCIPSQKEENGVEDDSAIWSTTCSIQ